MIKTIFCASMFMLLLLSCEKEILHRTFFLKKDFPNTIGSWWVYKDGTETDTIKILDMITLQNKEVQRWVQINSSNRYSDTTYVVTDSSVRFYHVPNLSQAFLCISLPVVENNPWGPSDQAMHYSSQLETITVNNITYSDALYLHQSSPIEYGVSVDESIWIAKDIGVVKHDINGAGSPSHHYELVSYHLN